MSFLYPLGLLGLLGVPILVLIYIIKNKYTEQTVSSTYIWTYSERFLKKRKKLPKIAGLISLVLQILAVTLISFLIAHPVFTFPNAADEYCFIIDGSGSMQMKNGDKTRFECGKERISEIIDSSMKGGLYTLIYVGDDSTGVVFEREDDKEKALDKLSELTADYGENSLAGALGLAQEYFYENRALRTYLITDKTYNTHKNVEVINVSSDANNVSLGDASYDLENGRLTVTAKVTSHKTSCEREILLFIDSSETPVDSRSLALGAGKSETVAFELEIDSFDSVTLKLKEGDCLSSDNETVLYNVRRANIGKALIVSETPFFFESAIEVVSGEDAVSLSPKAYEDCLSGRSDAYDVSDFGLYVFDSYTPASMPKNGTVWLINQGKNLADSGFSVQGPVELEQSAAMELTDSTSSVATRLSEGIRGDDVHVFKYMKYGLYGDFTTLYSYNMQPLVFVGNNVFGNREVVFAFSLHDSNLPLLSDFIPLIRNLVTYSFPEVVERTSYKVGEKLEINVPAGFTDIRIDTPMGGVLYPSSPFTANETVLSEPGTYTVTLTSPESSRRYYVYAEYSEAESKVSVTEKSFSLIGDKGEGGRDGIYDDLIIFAIVLAIVILMDWMVYCYDKYQLR